MAGIDYYIDGSSRGDTASDLYGGGAHAGGRTGILEGSAHLFTFSLDCVDDVDGAHLLVRGPGRALTPLGAVTRSVGPRVKVACGAHGEGGRWVPRTTAMRTSVPVCLGALGSLHH